MQEVKFNYEGKNFIVVGASSGMGKQIALELSQAGANVLCLARRVEVMEQMKSEQGAGKIIPAFVDVTAATSKDWDAVIKSFVGEYGKINGGVYTAGIGGVSAFRNWNPEYANSVMDTSYWGMLRFMQSATKKRFADDGSSFVVFASIAARVSYQGQLFYASAKSAVQTAVRIIAKEISPNKHRFNSVSPGWVMNTEMSNQHANDFGIPQDMQNAFLLGEGTADKVSGMVLFLLSDRADWITGTDIVVDGGQLLGGI
ncbi:MAG: SDR family oxidoreductase [Selenomonadaceae bacterium]|nr:SDR family oxidoreductase [Selenomonadaceae bacterium]